MTSPMNGLSASKVVSAKPAAYKAAGMQERCVESKWGKSSNAAQPSKSFQRTYTRSNQTRDLNSDWRKDMNSSNPISNGGNGARNPPGHKKPDAQGTAGMFKTLTSSNVMKSIGSNSSGYYSAPFSEELSSRIVPTETLDEDGELVMRDLQRHIQLTALFLQACEKWKNAVNRDCAFFVFILQALMDHRFFMIIHWKRDTIVEAGVEEPFQFTVDYNGLYTLYYIWKQGRLKDPNIRSADGPKKGMSRMIRNCYPTCTRYASESYGATIEKVTDVKHRYRMLDKALNQFFIHHTKAQIVRKILEVCAQYPPEENLLEVSEKGPCSSNEELN